MLRAGAVGPGRQASRVSVPSCCRTRQRHAARTAKAMSVVTLPSLSDMAASIDSAALAHISKIDQAGWTPASDSSSGVAVLVVIGIGLLASYAAYSVQDKSAMEHAVGIEVKGNDVTQVAREREEAALGGGPAIAVAGTSAETSNTAAVTAQPIAETATARAAEAVAAAPPSAKRDVQDWIANFMDKHGGDKDSNPSSSARSASAPQGGAHGAAATEGAAAAQAAAAAAAAVPGTSDLRLPGFLDRSEERAEKEQLAALKAAAARDAGEVPAAKAADVAGADGGNPWQAFLAWLKRVWQAILRMLGMGDNASGAPKAA